MIGIRRIIWIATLLPLVMTGISGCINDNAGEPDEVWSVAPGERCPQFSVTLADGRTVSTGSLAGKRSMIVFFNTSCTDCQRELPVIEAVSRELLHGAEGETGSEYEIICIARAEEAPSIETFWQKAGLSLPYSPQPERRVYNLFASTIIPRIYIICPDLVIRQVFTDDPLPSAEMLVAAMRG